VHSFPAGRGALNGDLVVGTTDGINSAMRERLVGHPNKLSPTGYLAYGLWLKTKDIVDDPKLREFRACR